MTLYRDTSGADYLFIILRNEDDLCENCVKTILKESLLARICSQIYLRYRIF